MSFVFKHDGSPDPFLESMRGRVYHDPWRRIDTRPLAKEGDILKAAWSLDTVSITSPKRIPIYLLPDYVLTVPTEFPFFNAIPKKAVEGSTMDYVRITALGTGAAARAESWEPADGDMTVPTDARVTKYVRIVGAAGKVSGLAQRTARGFKDLLATLVQLKQTDMLTILESYACSGNDAASPPQPQGFIPMQSTTNATDKAGAAVTLADIRTAIRAAYVAGGSLENYGFAVTDPATYDYIKTLLTEYLNYEPTAYHLPWGLRTYEFEGVPFIKSRGMPTGSGVKEILFLDRRVIFCGVALDMTYEELAKTGDISKFQLLWYGNYVNQAPEFCARIYNIL